MLLSFNRPHLLQAALESIANQTHPIEEIVVIDNPSVHSPRIKEIAESYERVRLIQNDANMGFTGGMNLGLQLAVGEFVLLTEDDITLAPDAVSELVRFAVSEQHTGVMAGMMLNESDGSLRCAGGHIELSSPMRLKVVDDPNAIETAQPYDVTYLPGAFLFASRNTWHSLRGFRDCYFMYYEDVDLCVRLRKHKRRITVVPTVVVKHFAPEPGSTPAWIESLKVLNFLRLYSLNAAPPTFVRFFVRYFIVGLAQNLRTNPRMTWHLIRALTKIWLDIPMIIRERLADNQRLEASSPIDE